MESSQIERWPKGIAVTSSGELVYTDDTLNIMNKTYLNSDVGLKLADCIHCSVCNTLYGDLLVVNQKLCVMIMGYQRHDAFNTVTNISIYQVVALNRWVRNRILDICSGGQSGWQIPLYLHLSSLHNQSTILSIRYYYRQPESDSNIKLLQPPHPQRGSDNFSYLPTSHSLTGYKPFVLFTPE